MSLSSDQTREISLVTAFVFCFSWMFFWLSDSHAACSAAPGCCAVGAGFGGGTTSGVWGSFWFCLVTTRSVFRETPPSFYVWLRKNFCSHLALLERPRSLVYNRVGKKICSLRFVPSLAFCLFFLFNFCTMVPIPVSSSSISPLVSSVPIAFFRSWNTCCSFTSFEVSTFTSEV